ncbi:unnamed protein product [Prorocentrum cordatum]|uniref:Uncharacterized protein n=1 Tax=Prorocentrum cordatum TaxID=2364126 RepID=A0ABN9U7E0_9DINO|nr:unnamed protein product [Polarella glacialis]|mmetsp:Transcript_73174/g.197907  ORF Transcript_73174/g.197907 Transcript_73174/m.197907 type:complete len:140 (+) Transcript_73174:105-524(+)
MASCSWGCTGRRHCTAAEEAETEHADEDSASSSSSDEGDSGSSSGESAAGAAAVAGYSEQDELLFDVEHLRWGDSREERLSRLGAGVVASARASDAERTARLVALREAISEAESEGGVARPSLEQARGIVAAHSRAGAT